MSDTTTITDLIARWNTDEGKPYKGSLIDMNAYGHAPDDIGCMCAQGQLLHLVGGWSVHRLNRENSTVADAAISKLLNVSHTHAVLLRTVNDRLDGAPSVVLTDPGKVLGDQWSKLLDFWCHLDGMTRGQWGAARDVARDAARAAARVAAGAVQRNVAWDAAWDAGGASSWDVAGASSEVQGAEVMRAKGVPLFFLPAFGFADPSDIPPRPAGYGIALNKEPKP